MFSTTQPHEEYTLLTSPRMVKTGDWATADLVKYLVSVKDKLSPTEMDRLKATAAFRKEGSTDPQSPRFRASDLYEPQESLRQLSLPIIDWGGNTKWKHNSIEGTYSSTSIAYWLFNYFAQHNFLRLSACDDSHPLKRSSSPVLIKIATYATSL